MNTGIWKPKMCLSLHGSFFTIRMLLTFKISLSPSFFHIKRDSLLHEAIFKLIISLKKKKKNQEIPGQSSG